MNSKRLTHAKRGLNKIRKARSIAIILLIGVIFAIVFIDKRDQTVKANSPAKEPVGLSQNTQSSHSELADLVSTMRGETPTPVVVSSSVTEGGNNIVPLGDGQRASTISAASGPSAERPATSSGRQNSATLARSGVTAGEKRGGVSHVVVDGETLSSIAHHYFKRSSYWNLIYKANKNVLHSPKSLRKGMQLAIPELEPKPASPGTSVSPATSPAQEKVVSPTVLARADSSSAATPKRLKRKANQPEAISPGLMEKNDTTYIVRKNDTLHSISKRTGYSFIALLDLNQQLLQGNPNVVKEGTRLRLPQ